MLGTTEIANASRAVTYTRGAECLGRTNVRVGMDDSWPLTSKFLGHEPYESPAADGAPWFDPAVPESGDFYGVWPMSVDGLDTTEIKQAEGQAAGDGGYFGIPRAPIRVVKVEALVLASTPAGGAYGLTWLSQALLGDSCSAPSTGRVLRFLRSLPITGAVPTTPDVMAAGLHEERSVLDVVCTDVVSVKDAFGAYLPDGRRAPTCSRVTFALSAGNPWLWGAERQLVAAKSLASGTAMTVAFERQESGVCPSACAPTTPRLTDPSRPPVTPLPRPITPAASVGCEPLESKRIVAVVPSAAVSNWETVVPTVIVRTGPVAERNVRIQWVRGSGVVDLQCNTIGEAMIGYVPPNATFILDGVTGKPVANYNGLSNIDATAVVSGRSGGPWRAPQLRCGSAHSVVVDASISVHPSTTVEVVGRSRQ